MIHYHGAPCSGTRKDASVFFAGRHGLVSFANRTHIEVVAEVCQSFILDNGAFSNWKKGASVDVKGYASFVGDWYRHPGFDWCLIPDKIDGTAEENRRHVFDWVGGVGHFFASVPVFHYHEPDWLLDEYCRLFKRIALGSSDKYSRVGTAQWWSRTREIFRVICDEHGRPRVKVHGLRMLNVKVFTELPFSSADSCNATVNAGSKKRFGMYMPPDSGTRANVIASRIEAHNSSPIFNDPEASHA